MSADKIITTNGMTIHCYGTAEPGNNYLMIGEYKNGEELEEITADCEETGWEKVTTQITNWAKRIGATIQEIQSC